VGTLVAGGVRSVRRVRSTLAVVLGAAPVAVGCGDLVSGDLERGSLGDGADPGGPLLVPCDESLLPQVSATTQSMVEPHWGWADGVAMYGLAVHLEQGVDDEAAIFVQTWTDARLGEGVELSHVNQMAPGWALLTAYRETGDPQYLDEARAIAAHFVERHPRAMDGAWLHAGESVWVDTMFMGPAFLAELSAVSGEVRWRDEALHQLDTHADWLWDGSAALFEHGAPTQTVLDPSLVPSPVYWGRGNAWAALATAEVLARTDGGAQRSELEQRFVAHLEALRRLQDESGGWHTLVDEPSTYLESSATAGIARAFELAAAEGLVDEYEASAVVSGACGFLGERSHGGELRGVSGSTAYGIAPEAYGEIASDAATSWGQGLWLSLLAGP